MEDFYLNKLTNILDLWKQATKTEVAGYETLDILVHPHLKFFIKRGDAEIYQERLDAIGGVEAIEIPEISDDEARDFFTGVRDLSAAHFKMADAKAKEFRLWGLKKMCDVGIQTCKKELEEKKAAIDAVASAKKLELKNDKDEKIAVLTAELKLEKAKLENEFQIKKATLDGEFKITKTSVSNKSKVDISEMEKESCDKLTEAKSTCKTDVAGWKSRISDLISSFKNECMDTKELERQIQEMV